MSALMTIDNESLALVAGGTDWRMVRQVAVVGAGIGAPAGAYIGSMAGLGVASVPGAAIGAVVGAGIGAATGAVQGWAMDRWGK